MKQFTYFRFTYILIFLMLTFLSCKKDTEPMPTPIPLEPVFTQGFSAKVDGVIFEETSLTATEDVATNSITVIASKSPYPAIKLIFMNTIAPGIYAFNGPSGPKRGLYYLSETEEFAAFSSTGTLKIISHDLSTNRIEAEFFYLAELGNDDYNITEGSFKLEY
jgi:hypothetical protein